MRIVCYVVVFWVDRGFRVVVDWVKVSLDKVLMNVRIRVWWMW